MKEPTREQIKEAFKKTIERWEKIGREPDFFNQSKCTLCTMESDDDRYICSRSCPIRLYTGNTECNETPYKIFWRNKTPENALSELNFLRKVYIWWIEKEVNKIWEKYGMDKPKKEEKKEEWVDVAEELTAQVYETINGFAVNIYHNDLNVAFIDGDGICPRSGNDVRNIYKTEVSGDGFRIRRKS